MREYAMLFEELTLLPWGNHWRRSDPFQLGDADTYRLVDNELSGQNGVNAKFALFAAVKKIIADNINSDEVHIEALRQIQQRIWALNSLNDLCVIMDELAPLYEAVGYVVTS